MEVAGPVVGRSLQRFKLSPGEGCKFSHQLPSKLCSEVGELHPDFGQPGPGSGLRDHCTTTVLVVQPPEEEEDAGPFALTEGLDTLEVLQAGQW